MAYDILQQELKVGDFCVRSGGGNAKCEYSVVFCRVTGLPSDQSKIQVERLTVSWTQVSHWDVLVKRSTMDAVKVVKLNCPNKALRTIFDFYRDNPGKEHPEYSKDAVSRMCHGARPLYKTSDVKDQS